MEDYYYYVHCFAPTSWEIDHNAKAGPGHADCSAAVVGELHHHYLDACFRCGRLLARNKDIFMYRGDTPFCSEECRRQQIDADEAKEKRSKHSAGSWKQAESSSPQWILVGELPIEATAS